MEIFKHMGNSTPIRLYTNDSPEGPLSNRGSGIAGIFLGFNKIRNLYTTPTIPYISKLIFTNNTRNDHNGWPF